MTEFGRTVHQNGTSRTDHGRASGNLFEVIMWMAVRYMV